MAQDIKKDFIFNEAVYISNLWKNLVQVIIQSRLGEKAHTIARSPAKGSSMFNLEINLDDEITSSVKKYLGHQTLTFENPFTVEILLRTKDGELMVLELWTLSMEETDGLCPQKHTQIITDRMSILLKSAICISRITPAYGLSFRQGYQTFVILYRLYGGRPDSSTLGENFYHMNVGQTNFESCNLSLSLSYRTVLALPSRPSRPHSHDQMMLRSDHFKNEPSPPLARKTYDRTSDSSDAVQTSDESQDAIRLPFVATMDLHSTSPRSRTSSESSYRGQQKNLSSEKIHVPFASNRPASLEESSISGELSFPSLLVSAIGEKLDSTTQGQVESKYMVNDTLIEGDLSALGNRPPSREDLAEALNSLGPPEPHFDDPCQSRNCCFSANVPKFDLPSDAPKPLVPPTTPKDDAEYVLVDLKSPFVAGDNNDLELSTFFREWQTAPQLQLFAREDAHGQRTGTIPDQIKSFESCLDDYDDLVRSLHVRDNSSPETG